MLILNSGYSVSLNIAAGDKVTVSTTGLFKAEAVSGLGIAAGVIDSAYDGTKTYSFSSAGVLKLTASNLDCTYDQYSGNLPVTSLTDASGNILGLASGNSFAIQNSKKNKLYSALRAFIEGLTTRPPVILAIGDSNFAAYGAGDGGTAANNAQSKSPANQILSFISSVNGATLINSGFFGDGNLLVNNSIPIATYDPRQNLGTSWTQHPTNYGLGSKFYIQPTGNSDYFTFASGLIGNDTFEIHYPVFGGLSASVGVYASDNTLIGSFNNTVGSGGLGVSTFTSPKFAIDGIVKIRNNGGGDGLMFGGFFYSSTQKQIVVIQAPRAGGKVADFSTSSTSWDGVNLLKTLKPSLTYVCLTINDIVAGTTASAYNSALDTIVAAASLTGDVTLMTGVMSNTANWVNGNYQVLEQQMDLVAAKYNADTISMHNEFGSYATAAAAGYMYDILHCVAKGYKDKYANRIARNLVGMT